MKKILFVIAAVVAISFMACGNATQSGDVNDSDSVAVDTMVIDTMVVDSVAIDTVVAE
jgi:outer membrane lipoprotein SlyB